MFVFVFFVFAVCPGFPVGFLAVVGLGWTRKYTRASHATRSLQISRVMLCYVYDNVVEYVGMNYCSSQPSSVHWLSSSIFPCSVVRPSVPLW